MSKQQDMKTTIQNGYDTMADEYLQWTQSKADSPRTRYLESLLQYLPTTTTTTSTGGKNNAVILELGCGAGTPVLETLVQHAGKIYANDISSRQIQLAKERCPQNSITFFPGDMMALDFPPGSLDAAVAFFSIFHLPCSEQEEMFRRVFGWLKEGGLFAFNLGTEITEGKFGEFFGVEMVWSGWGVEGSRAVVGEVGFEVLRLEVLDADDDDRERKVGDPDAGKKFLWMLVRKPVAEG